MASNSIRECGNTGEWPVRELLVSNPLPSGRERPLLFQWWQSSSRIRRWPGPSPGSQHLHRVEVNTRNSRKKEPSLVKQWYICTYRKASSQVTQVSSPLCKALRGRGALCSGSFLVSCPSWWPAPTWCDPTESSEPERREALRGLLIGHTYRNKKTVLRNPAVCSYCFKKLNLTLSPPTPYCYSYLAWYNRLLIFIYYCCDIVLFSN